MFHHQSPNGNLLRIQRRNFLEKIVYSKGFLPLSFNDSIGSKISETSLLIVSCWVLTASVVRLFHFRNSVAPGSYFHGTDCPRKLWNFHSSVASTPCKVLSEVSQNYIASCVGKKIQSESNEGSRHSVFELLKPFWIYLQFLELRPLTKDPNESQ